MKHSGDRPWHWEGNVQQALRGFLEEEGWTITSAANTETKETGIDLAAHKGTRELVVEVKGFPTNTYQYGEKRGKPKPTPPTNQARQWFSHALLSMMLLRGKQPLAEVALCFPDFPTYRKLLQKTCLSFATLGVGVYLVQKDGAVEVEFEHMQANP